MAIKINISGSNIEDSEILSGINIGRNGNIDVDIKDSCIAGDSQVLNDVKLQNGKITYRANGVKISDNARVMNGREIKDGETVVIEQGDLHYTETTQRPERVSKSQAEPSHEKKAKKESVLEKLLKIFKGKSQPKDSLREEEKSKTSNVDAYEEFLNMISGNGEYRKPEYSQVKTIHNEQDGEKQRNPNGR